MRTCLVSLLLILFSCLPNSLVARELVLVGHTQHFKKPFNTTQLRRLFLGYPVQVNNSVTHALRNTHDKDMYQIFLQNVMFMSKRNYERRLLSLNFSKGNLSVPEYKDPDKLLSKIKSRRDTLSYLWRDEIIGEEHLQVIQVLWSDQ